jgi:plasmid maintenance system antidote protein VapI
MSKVNSDYSNAIAERIKTIMQIAGLEILGISKLTGISDSHIYSLLNGRRNLTDEVAKIIGHSLEFDGMLVFKLNKDVP